MQRLSMQRSSLFVVNKDPEKVNQPVIAVMGTSIPNSADCVKKIDRLISKLSRKPTIILYQPDLGLMHENLKNERWDAVISYFFSHIIKLQEMGVNEVILQASLPDYILSSLQRFAPIPIINIKDVIVNACEKEEMTKIGVLDRSMMMNYHSQYKPFSKAGIEVVLPDKQDRVIVDKVIVNEASPQGMISEVAMKEMVMVIQRLKIEGCQAIAVLDPDLALCLSEKKLRYTFVESGKFVGRRSG